MCLPMGALRGFLFAHLLWISASVQLAFGNDVLRISEDTSCELDGRVLGARQKESIVWQNAEVFA